MKRIFLLSGKAEAGKTTAANLMNLHASNSIVANFAGSLKFYAASLFSWNGLKNDIGRKLLQDLGTNVREQYPNHWVQSLYEVLTSTSTMWDNCFIDDWRYPNEFNYMNDLINHKNFAIIKIRIERFHDGEVFQNSLSPEARLHTSEVALDHFKMDKIIINDQGIEELRYKSNEFIDQFV